jgi:hypothetical protein
MTKIYTLVNLADPSDLVELAADNVEIVDFGPGFTFKFVEKNAVMRRVWLPHSAMWELYAVENGEHVPL